jgi:type I restriction enzyme S subunit
MSDDLLDLPEGWVVENLELIVRDGRIGLVRSAKEQSTDQGFPYVRMQHYDLQGNWNFRDLTKVYATSKELDIYELQENDILFNTRNSYELVGKVAIWNFQKSGYLYNNNLIRFRFYNGVFPQWIGYQMMSPQFRKNLEAFKSATTSVCAIYTKDINNQPILLPPLNEQKRIVAKIEELNDRSQTAQKALETIPQLCDRFRQSVLAAAFRGDLTADWREKNPDVEPASVLLERIKKERHQKWEETEVFIQNSYSLKSIPESWTWTNISHLSYVVRGASPRPAGDPKYFGGNIPWITVAEVTKDNEIYLRSTSRFLTEEGKKASRFLESRTFILTNSGATLGVPKITKIAGCINDGSVALLSLNEDIELYLYYFLTSITQQLRTINQGAAQPNLNTTIVKSILVPLPPLEEQKEIVFKIQSIFTAINNIEKQHQQATEKLEKLNQSILSKAFRGELVPQDPEDEPASVLLARIRAEREKLNNNKPTSTSKRKGKTPKEQGTIPGLE